jgi:hypothetical protein
VALALKVVNPELSDNKLLDLAKEIQVQNNILDERKIPDGAKIDIKKQLKQAQAPAAETQKPAEAPVITTEDAPTAAGTKNLLPAMTRGGGFITSGLKRTPLSPTLASTSPINANTFFGLPALSQPQILPLSGSVIQPSLNNSTAIPTPLTQPVFTGQTASVNQPAVLSNPLNPLLPSAATQPVFNDPLVGNPNLSKQVFNEAVIALQNDPLGFSQQISLNASALLSPELRGLSSTDRIISGTNAAIRKALNG